MQFYYDAKAKKEKELKDAKDAKDAEAKAAQKKMVMARLLGKEKLSD